MPETRPGSSASAPVEAAADRGTVKELRLALVCYGGVSLAIYMHGATKEILKLAAASRARELDPERNPFPSGTERAYWEALKDLERMEGVRTRVVVDIIAGTSAGGINGVYLAKALARNQPLEALRSMWLDYGDINRLLVSHRVPTLPLKVLAWALGNAVRRVRGRPARPPLDGDQMLRWLYEALSTMDRPEAETARPLPGLDSLMPPGHDLELFVTATDLAGYGRRVPAYSPKQVRDLWHRHVLEFRRDGDGRDQFGMAYNAALAFAARATSCFPGASPPIDLRTAGEVLRAEGWPGDFPREFARIYGLSQVDVAESHFIDGGVLDNFPFRLAIDAIMQRRAWTEVDRRLVYIEPHPMAPPAPPAAPGPDSPPGRRAPPGMLRTIWAGLSTIPRHEPILTDLLSVREFNDRVRQVADIVRAGFQDIGERVRAVQEELRPGEGTVYDRANRELSAAAAASSDFAFIAYNRVKLHSVIDRFAEVACEICRYPRDSNHAAFVRAVLHRWAGRERVLEPRAAPSDRQVEFLRSFDLDYRERRLRFVIKGINELYEGVERRDAPPRRADLDRAKAALWDSVQELRAMVARIVAPPRAAGAPARIRDGVARVFDEREIAEVLSDPTIQDEDGAIRRFLDRSHGALNAARDELRDYLHGELRTFGPTLFARFRAVTGDWEEGVRRGLLVRYLGFPYWDILIYPIQRMSQMAEMNRIEVVRMSPEDVSLLEPRGSTKLGGIRLGHFGAFFDRRDREGDYLWGRLDGAERLLWMLWDRGSGPDPGGAFATAARRHSLAAFREVLDEEEAVLAAIPDRIRALRQQLDRLTGGAPDSAGSHASGSAMDPGGTPQRP